MITFKYVCRTICAIGALILVGCVDKSYRVDDVSLEVTVGSDTTTLPLGYFEQKTLRDLLGDQTIEGLEEETDGSLSFKYDGQADSFCFEDITSEFDIEKIESMFVVDYPQFDFDMMGVVVERSADIDFITGFEDYLLNGSYYIPEGVQLPTIRGEYQMVVSSDDLHLEFDVPEQVKQINRVIFRDIDKNHHGAPMHLSVDLNDFADINGGGELKFDLTIDGGKFRILDSQNNEICNGDHYKQTYPIEAGAKTIDFVIYIESLTNTTAIDENHHIDIHLELTYDMEFELTAKSGTFSLDKKPHIELYSDFEYGDADVNLDSEVELVDCKLDNNAPISIEGLPEQLKAVNCVALKQDESAVLRFYTHGLEWLGEDVANDLEIVVDLPHYLKLHAVSGENYQYDANTHMLTTNIADLDKGVLIGIDALDFGSDGIEPKDGKISLEFEPAIRAHFKQGSSLNVSALQHESDLELSVGIEQMKLCVESISGRVDYSYNIDQEFEISGLNDINLEIKGLGLKPIFEVNISHPLTIEALLSGTITPCHGGVAAEENALTFSDIVLAAARYANGSITPSNIRLIIADGSLRDKYNSPEYTFVECDVEKLLRGSLPDGFKINLTLGIDSTEVQTLYIADSFDITYDYRVDIPITLDNSLNISYADEIYDLNSTFSTLADYDIKVDDVTLIAVVTNSTPLELSAEVTLKDANGNDTEAQVRIAEGAKILGSTNGEVVESSLRLGIDLGESASIAKLAEVDGIAFALTATSAALDDSVALSLDQTIGVKLQLEVAGGVTIDLESLKM